MTGKETARLRVSDRIQMDGDLAMLNPRLFLAFLWDVSAVVLQMSFGLGSDSVVL